jgi:transposase
MNPLIGLDLSKGESQVQAFLEKGKPHRKSFSITHDLQGLGSLFEFLQDVEKGLVVIIINSFFPSLLMSS